MRLAGALIALVLLEPWGPSWLWANDMDGFFETPTEEAPQPDAAASPPALERYRQAQDKMMLSFSLNSAGGAYVGWTDMPDFDSPSSSFGHLAGITIGLTSAIDLRPFDYFRLHGSFLLEYPTDIDGVNDFSPLSLNELFFDYATPGLLSMRVGRYALAWGNARILSAANLPGRTVDVSVLSSSIDIKPSWLASSNPSLWLKAALPLGRLTLTGLAGLPSEVGTGLSAMGYGGLAEYVTGKTCLSLAGYYKSDRTPRIAAMIKTSAWGLDLFVDSAVSFQDFPALLSPLPVVTGGLYWQTKSGPDIRVTSEIRYNGEADPGAGTLVADALPIGGLSHVVAAAWSHVRGSTCSLGATWYQSWEDGSGAIVPSFSSNLMPLVSIRAVFPIVYGSSGSEYRKDPPAETAGYVVGFGLFVVLDTSF